jgi:tetratricopeptide (TPR) repeat protein
LPEIRTLWDFGDPAASERRFLELVPQAEAAGAPGYAAEALTQAARAQGLQRRFEEAHATLDRAEALLDAGADRARVRLLLERGRALNSSKRAEESLPFFEAAWELAQRIGEDGLAVDAAHMLGIAADPDAALDWNARAIAYAEQSAQPAAKAWLGALYNNTGWTHFDRREYAAAVSLLERAEAWYLERGGPEQIRIAKYSVGKTLRMLGRVAEALAIQEALQAGLEEGQEDGYVSEELGECLLALGRAPEARPHLQRAFELLRKDPWLAEAEPERIARLGSLATDREPGGE